MKLQHRILLHGFVAGMIGYAAVAVYFGVVNLVLGRSIFYTPALLGGWLFYGVDNAAQTMVAPGPILAYNGVHLVMFFGFGVIAAAAAAVAERLPVTLYPLLALGLGFLLIHYVFYLTIPAGIAASLPGWSVGGAAAVGLAGMGTYLLRAHRRLRAHLRLYPAGDDEYPGSGRLRRSLRPGEVEGLIWSASRPLNSPTDRDGTRRYAEEIRLAYCPALDREVRLALLAPELHRGHGKANGIEIVCRDFGSECRDPVCALFGVDVDVMRARLVRSGGA